MKPFEFTKRNVKKDDAVKSIILFPKGHLFLASGLAFVLLAATMATYSDKTSERSAQTIALQLHTSNQPSISSAQNTSQITLTKEDATIKTGADKSTATIIKVATVAPTIEPSNIWHTEIVKPGDSLSFLFNRAGLSDLSLHKFLSSNKSAAALKRIYPGQRVEFNINDDSELLGLKFQKNRLNHIEFTKTDKGFVDNSIAIKPDSHIAYREATITSSLFLAGTAAGLEQSSIMELANIFGWDIDFALDIRTNDSFKVLYEERFINGEKIGNGPILAAEFTNQSKTFKAVRYTDADGNTNYYTPEGKSMRKAFLRTPVDFARISSHFNLKRKHPILNRIRAHKGTDYAAPTGTPIKAAGNGKVEFAGVKGGYGRTVVIRHGQSYKTLYAHMHKYGKGIRTGTRVKQGQIIGYVGKSGLATGPHLHYEFYKNGVVRNPVRVELPKAESIPKTLLANFKQQTQPLVAQMYEFTNNTTLALSTEVAHKDDAISTN
jgi:murein DD-endopeptidase MepM/ murein hydrolase activator NlpD